MPDAAKCLATAALMTKVLILLHLCLFFVPFGHKNRHTIKSFSVLLVCRTGQGETAPHTEVILWHFTSAFFFNQKRIKIGEKISHTSDDWSYWLVDLGISSDCNMEATSYCLREVMHSAALLKQLELTPCSSHLLTLTSSRRGNMKKELIHLFRACLNLPLLPRRVDLTPEALVATSSTSGHSN